MALNPRATAATDEDLIPASEVDRIVNERIATAVEERLAGETDRITAKIMERLAEAQANQGAMNADVLAMAIATLTDQGTGRKRIAPEVQKARDEAKVRMDAAIERALAEKRPARYQLRAATYLDEILVPPKWVDQWHRAQPMEIEWPHAPNSAMIPLNDTAKEIYGEYAKWIGEVKPRDFGDHKTTAKGLVVLTRNAAPPDDIPETAMPRAGSANQGLKMGGRPGAAETYTEVSILGNIHPPARQSA